MFIHALFSTHPIMICKIFIYKIHSVLPFSQQQNVFYSIIQENLVHKRLDCVNIVLSFSYQIQNNVNLTLQIKQFHSYYFTQ